MSIMKNSIMVTTLMILAACGQQGPVTPTETNNQVSTETIEQEIQTKAVPEHAYTQWAGKWIGVEGMFVEITLLETGKYNLVMQSDLDTFGTYVGTDGETGIDFTRNDQVFTLRNGTGDDTGLRNLFGKKDCLMVASGEGYCRDQKLKLGINSYN